MWNVNEINTDTEMRRYTKWPDKHKMWLNVERHKASWRSVFYFPNFADAVQFTVLSP